MNGAAFLWIHQFAGRSLLADDLGVFIAEYLPYLMIAAFLFALVYVRGWKRRWYLFAEAAVAVMLSRGVVVETIRFFYHHERPFSFYGFSPLVEGLGWSFPSGHASWFFALSMVIWYFNRKLGAWFFLLSFINGIARIYAGVHWPFDIAGGIATGIACGAFVHWLFGEPRARLDQALRGAVQ